MNKKHKGAWSELHASTWLLEQGYEVFRNVSPHGNIDIIARNPETKKLLLIDVKTSNKAKLSDGSYKYYDSLRKNSDPDVIVLGVNTDTGECKLASSGSF